MRLAPVAVLALAALALAGCETTQEESARLEKVAHAKKVAKRKEELRVTTASRTLKVLAASVVHSSEGSAVVIAVANSGRAQREAPLQFSIAQGGSSPVTNTGPGLSHSLTSLAYVPAHGTAVWVDDQVTLGGSPGAVTVKLGEGSPLPGAPPQVTLGTHRLEQEGAGESLSGTVTNDSAIEQHELVVYAVAKRGTRTVAAGRAVISALAPHSSANYQAFLLGAPTHGARLALSAPPTTFG